MSANSGWRNVALGILRMFGLSLAIAVLAGAVIAGSAVGGGVLAVRLFVSPEDREATVNLAGAFWFSAGAVIGVIVSALLVIGVGNLASEYLDSSDDETMASRRDRGA